MTQVQLIPLHTRRVLARKHAKGKTLDNCQLLRVIQEHAGHFVRTEGPLRTFADGVAKAATKPPGGGTAGVRVDAMVSTLQDYSVHYRQAEAPFCSAARKYVPDFVEHITIAVVDVASPIVFQNLAKGKLKDISKWKKDPNKVIKVLT